MVKEVETLAKEERRTKSELFREMVRVYHRFRDQRDREETRWVTNLIQEANVEQAKKPMTADEIIAASEQLAGRGQSGRRSSASRPIPGA